MQLQDYSIPIEKLKKELENNPDNIDLLLKLTDLYLKSEGDNYYNSVITLDKILSLDPLHLPANRIRGLIYKEMDNPVKAIECFKTILDAYANAADHPEYLSVLFDYADLLEQVDREEEAIEIFKQLLQRNPKDLSYLFKLAHLYVLVDRNEDSIEVYQSILEIDPENEVALAHLVDLYEKVDKKLYYTTRAELAMKEGSLNRAVGEYKKLFNICIEPEEIAEVHKKLAQLYYIQKEYNKSLDEYNLAFDILSHDYDLLKGMGKVYFEMEEYEIALENFQQALDYNDKDYTIFIDLAECYLELEKYPEALKELETVKMFIPDDMDIRCALAESYIHIRNYYKAQEELDYVLAREPENTRALGCIVDLNLEKEDYNKALEISMKLVKLKPNSPFSARKMAEAYKALGDDYNAHYNLGLSYELQSEHGMATDEFLHALEFQPDNADLLLKIADLYILMDEKFVGMEYYEKAAEADPTNTVVLKKLADFYISHEELDRAIEAYMAIVEVNNKDSEAYYNIASLYEKQKYLEDALETYYKFIELAPNNNKSDAVRKKIASLEKKLGKNVSVSVDDDEMEEMTLFEKIVSLFKPGDR